MSSLNFYHGPHALLYRAVCVTGVSSGVLLAIGPVLDIITPNDFSIGLLLIAVSEFAVGLGILASLLFLLLMFFRDVPKRVKLLGLAVAIFPYIVVAILLLTAMSTHGRR